MEILKLIYNEIIKIFKRKIVYIFAFIILIGIILSCVLVYANKKDMSKLVIRKYGHTDAELELDKSLQKYTISDDNASEYDKKVATKKLEVLDYISNKGPENIYTAPYKSSIEYMLNCSYEKICALDENENKEEYTMLESDIARLWSMLENGTFEEYIQFNIDSINRDYENKIISESEYEQKLGRQQQNLKYGIYKDYSQNSRWKENMISFINDRKHDLNFRIGNSADKFYIDDDDVDEIKNEILLAEYRLENNKPPYFIEDDKTNDIDSYSRYKYNEFANKISIIIIGLLLIVLSSSSISDEFTKGTIKFALIAPYKRNKLLLAKIIALFIVMLVMVLITSQVSILVGNIIFGTNNNEYLYVKGGKVEVMCTYVYEFLQYILRMPELTIYILIGITMSSLTKNTPVSTIVTTAAFIGIPTLLDYISGFRRVEFFKYLPFTNFNLTDRILKIYTFSTSWDGDFMPENELSFSIFLITLLAALLIITVFDSFRKKEI